MPHAVPAMRVGGSEAGAFQRLEAGADAKKPAVRGGLSGRNGAKDRVRPGSEEEAGSLPSGLAVSAD